MNTKKAIIGGILAGIALNLMSFLFSMFPGKNEFYSQRFPELMTRLGMGMMILSLLLIGIFMGLIYGVINTSLPKSQVKKGAIFGVMTFLLVGTMWPVMMISFTSAYIWITELVFGLIQYVIAGLIVAGIYKK